MRKQRKAAEEKKQTAKAAKDWRDKASGRSNAPSTAKRWVTILSLLRLSPVRYIQHERVHGRLLSVMHKSSSGACYGQYLQGPV